MIGASIWIAFATANVDVSESIDRPIAETTPTESERLLAERAPDRRDRLADDDAPTTAERDGRERVVGRRDAEDADVAEEIPADELRLARARRR